MGVLRLVAIGGRAQRHERAEEGDAMSEYDMLRRRSCLRKRAYGERKARIIAANASDPRLHAYFCTFCAYWHIGHFSAMGEYIESQRPENAIREPAQRTTEPR